MLCLLVLLEWWVTVVVGDGRYLVLLRRVVVRVVVGRRRDVEVGAGAEGGRRAAVERGLVEVLLRGTEIDLYLKQYKTERMTIARSANNRYSQTTTRVVSHCGRAKFWAGNIDSLTVDISLNIDFWSHLVKSSLSSIESIESSDYII